MNFNEKSLGNVTVVELKGDVLGGPDATLLNNRLKEHITSGNKNFVIDLAKVEYMNSSGLGMMTSALSTVKSNGGALKLANPAERIKSLLVITKLIQVFETFDSLDGAVASFK